MVIAEQRKTKITQSTLTDLNNKQLSDEVEQDIQEYPELYSFRGQCHMRTRRLRQIILTKV